VEQLELATKLSLQTQPTLRQLRSDSGRKEGILGKLYETRSDLLGILPPSW
jgi:hypothetical protein